jgi:shikimate dehydrogenase
MQNAAFAAAGLPHLYLRYRVPPEDLPRALREARTLGMGGLNLTVPLKEVALPLLDAVTPEARRIGAVNTIVFHPRSRRALGDNTDGRGFLAAIRGRVRVRGATAVLVGAGGSARAVGCALAGAGAARIVIANRTAKRADRLAEHLRRLGVGGVEVLPLPALADGAALAGASLVVNTTPLGLGSGRLRVRWTSAPRRCLAVDLVYLPRTPRFARGPQAPRLTPFLATAARAGRGVMDGGPMLLHQGALAFEAWTGRRAPRAAMARALRAAGLALTGLARAGTIRARRPPTS